ncbi:hypothetical protein NADFUDRAFT_79740 [Nadsonia fulvescens var. elongata DSM 6958]|uniref:Uncharacterized protein n=1 Tax=Nadsonia fulvescens var. elongata DSM 6958 TaxID=857566 RepID=A0A1E3PFG5_9ASCO|nr:hypothetical protein NADFUDRAFT_79740 [Nadsonia fulvescens var. elongata DSM 6958]
MDKYSYLQPGYNPASLKVAELKRILTAHKVDFAPTAKKSALVTLFKNEITPKSARLLKSLAKKKSAKSRKPAEESVKEETIKDDENPLNKKDLSKEPLVEKKSQQHKKSKRIKEQSEPPVEPAVEPSVEHTVEIQNKPKKTKKRVSKSKNLSEAESYHQKHQPILVDTSDEELKAESAINTWEKTPEKNVNQKRPSPSSESGDESDSELPAPKRAQIETSVESQETPAEMRESSNETLNKTPVEATAKSPIETLAETPIESSASTPIETVAEILTESPSEIHVKTALEAQFPIENNNANFTRVTTDENVVQVTYEETDIVIRNDQGEIIEQDTTSEMFIKETSTHSTELQEQQSSSSDAILAQEIEYIEDGFEESNVEPHRLVFEQSQDPAIAEIEEMGQDNVVLESEPEEEIILDHLSNIISFQEPEGIEYRSNMISSPAGNLEFFTEEIVSVEEVVEEVFIETTHFEENNSNQSDSDQEDDYYQNKPKFIPATTLLGRLKQRSRHMMASSLILLINSVVLASSFVALFTVILTMGLYVQKLRRVGWCDVDGNSVSAGLTYPSNTGFDFSLLGKYEVKLSPVLDKIDQLIIPQPNCFKCPEHAECFNNFNQFGEINYNSDDSARCEKSSPLGDEFNGDFFVKKLSVLKYYSSYTRTWPFPIFSCVQNPQVRQLEMAKGQTAQNQELERKSRYEELRALVIDELRTINVNAFCDNLKSDIVDSDSENIGRVEVGELYRLVGNKVADTHLLTEFEDNWFDIIEELTRIPEFSIMTYTTDDNLQQSYVQNHGRKTKSIKSHDLTKIDSGCLRLKLMHDLRKLSPSSILESFKSLLAIDFKAVLMKIYYRISNSGVFLGSVKSSNEINNFDSHTTNAIASDDLEGLHLVPATISNLGYSLKRIISAVYLSFLASLGFIGTVLSYGWLYVTYPIRLLGSFLTWSVVSVWSMWYNCSKWVLTSYFDFLVGFLRRVYSSFHFVLVDVLFRGTSFVIFSARDLFFNFCTRTLFMFQHGAMNIVKLSGALGYYLVSSYAAIQHFLVDVLVFSLKTFCVSAGLAAWNYLVLTLLRVKNLSVGTKVGVENAVDMAHDEIDELAVRSKQAIIKSQGTVGQLYSAVVTESANAVNSAVYNISYIYSSIIKAICDLVNGLTYGIAFYSGKVHQFFVYLFNSIFHGIVYVFGKFIKAVYYVFYGIGFSYSCVINWIDFALSKITNGINFIFGKFVDGIMSILYNVGYVYGCVITVIDSVLQRLGGSIKYFFSSILAGISFGLNSIIYSIAYIYKSIITGITLGVESLTYGISYTVGKIVYTISQGLMGIVNGLTYVRNGITETIASIINGLVYGVAYLYGKLISGFNGIINGLIYIVGGVTAAITFLVNGFVFTVGYSYGMLITGFNSAIYYIGFSYYQIIAGIGYVLNNITYYIGFSYYRIIAGISHVLNKTTYGIGYTFGKFNKAVSSIVRQTVSGAVGAYNTINIFFLATLNRVVYASAYLYVAVTQGLLSCFSWIIYSLGYSYGKLVDCIVSGFNEVTWGISYVFSALVSCFNSVIYSIGYVYGNFAAVLISGFTKFTHAISYIYDRFNAALVSGLNNMSYGIGHFFGKITDGLISGFNGINYGIGYIYCKFTDGLSLCFQKITYSIGYVFGNFTQGISNVVSGVINSFINLFNHVRSALWSGVNQVEQAENEIKQVIGSTQNDIKQAIGSTQNGIQKVGLHYKESTLSMVNSIEAAIKQGGMNLVNMIQTIYETMVGACQSFVIGIFRTIYKFNADMVFVIQETVSNTIGFFRDFLLPSVVNSVKSFVIRYHHVFWIILVVGFIIAATKLWLEYELIEHNRAAEVVDEVANLLRQHKASHERYLRKAGIFNFANPSPISSHTLENDDGEILSYMLIDQVEAKIFPRATESKEDYRMWQRVVKLVERHSADNYYNNTDSHIVSKRFELNGEIVRAWEWVSPEKQLSQ